LGPDLQNNIPFKTRQKSDKTPQVLDLLPAFSKMFPGHISCDRFRGLPYKMTSLSRPDRNQISPPRCLTCSPLSPKCSLATFLVTGFGACPSKWHPFQDPTKIKQVPQELDLLLTFSKMFLGHICCDRLLDLTCKMASLSRPRKNQISPPGCWTCSTLFPKCSLVTFLVTGFWARLTKCSIFQDPIQIR